MFWSAPKKKKDDEKEKQVKELKQVFPSIRRPNNDDNLFEIKFVVNNQYSSLRVFIPADFPSTRPVLQASGPITHPWLDQFKQVNGSEKLMSWTRNSSLVEVVEESLSALLTGVNQAEGAASSGQTASSLPPTPTSMSSYPTPVPQPPARPNSNPDLHHSYPALSAYATHPPASNQWQPTSQQVSTTNSSMGIAAVQHPPARASQASADPSLMSESKRATSGGLPALPSSFPELEELTSAQLQRLLNDPVALEAHLDKVESVVQLQAVVEQVFRGNEDNARKNLQMEGELSAAAEEVEAQQSALKVQVLEYREKLDAVKRKCETPLDGVVKELKATRSDLDAKSEQLGADFVEGKMELNAFITDFLEQRTKYHELAARLKVVGK